MSPALEIIIQVIGLVLALWLIKTAYVANRKAEPFSLKATNEVSFKELYLAKGLVAGIIVLLLLAYKLLTCGVVCWT